MSHETGQTIFIPKGNEFEPTEWAVGPWSPDTLQGGAYGGLLARALERTTAGSGMVPARLSFDLWRPVTRDRLGTAVDVLREGRKARTVEATLAQNGKPVARCTAVFLRADPAAAPPSPGAAPPALGPDAGRPVPAHVRAWSPFFTGVDTRVVEGDLLQPGPAAAWFRLERPLVEGEANSPVVHAVSAADLASGISAIVDIRRWSFINADLTVTLWRLPEPPWILLRAETMRGTGGTGLAAGTLADVHGPVGMCLQTLLFEPRT